MLKQKLGAEAQSYTLGKLEDMNERLAELIRLTFGPPPHSAEAPSANSRLWDVRRAVVPDVELALAMTAQNILWDIAAQKEQREAESAMGLAVDAVETLEATLGPACQLSVSKLLQRVRRRVHHPEEVAAFLRAWQPCGQAISSFFRDWRVCGGTFFFQRGYPCGLWLLLHTVTVGIKADAQARAAAARRPAPWRATRRSTASPCGVSRCGRRGAPRGLWSAPLRSTHTATVM